MMYILANDAHIARQLGRGTDIPAEAWCNATAGKLRASPMQSTPIMICYLRAPR